MTSTPKLAQLPRKMPTIRKKLSEVPANPFHSSSTTFGAIEKQSVVPIPFVKDKSATFNINKLLT